MGVMDWLRGAVLGAGSVRLEDMGVRALCGVDELDGVLAESGGRDVLLFKHSTTCPISASAYRRVAAWLGEAGAAAPAVYLVKVIESRALSNEIAARLGVRHESPQVILVRGGQAVWHASHGGIDGAAIQRALG